MLMRLVTVVCLATMTPLVQAAEPELMAAPAMRAKNFVLVPGANELSIEYQVKCKAGQTRS